MIDNLVTFDQNLYNELLKKELTLEEIIHLNSKYEYKPYLTAALIIQKNIDFNTFQIILNENINKTNIYKNNDDYLIKNIAFNKYLSLENIKNLIPHNIYSLNKLLIEKYYKHDDIMSLMFNNVYKATNAFYYKELKEYYDQLKEVNNYLDNYNNELLNEIDIEMDR